MTPRVAAVIVTWNRLRLLRRLVRALEDATVSPDVVVVVDNASDDGTAQWLHEWSSAMPLRVVALPENTGGAGGFHEGIRAALAENVDLLWLMDDDGLPMPDCLERLLEGRDGWDLWGPLVVAEDDPGRLCFPVRLPRSKRVVRSVEDAAVVAHDGVIADVVIPFNGVLMTPALAEEIGLPRREFFIWGDDVEYLWRARRSGARVATLVGPRFHHPATDDLGSPMAFGLATYNHSPSELKHYCLVRNNVTNLASYRGWWAVGAFLLKTLWFYSVTRPSPSRLRLSLSAALAAARGDFSGHRRFLS